jgi:hypothetical protein
VKPIHDVSCAVFFFEGIDVIYVQLLHKLQARKRHILDYGHQALLAFAVTYIQVLAAL